MSSPKTFAFERSNFRKLIAQNPNYFGNQPGSQLKAAKAITFNTSYEELTCVGYNPELNELYATFQLKQDGGFSGDLCSPGSLEYIRFFVDYGSGWIDQGEVAVNVHDIPDDKDCFKDDEKPLSFTASLELKDAKRSFCGNEVLPRVRAILSWNNPIPSDPNHTPVWGNRKDCQIQLKPYFLTIKPELKEVFINEFLEIASANPQLTIAQAQAVVNAKSAGTTTHFADFAPKPLKLKELADLYKCDNEFTVAPLRFSLNSLQAMLQVPSYSEDSFEVIPELNLGELLEELENTSANTNFEELECLGLDYNRELLNATFRIKRSTGFSGGLCEKGSKEYVAFWADWDDNCEWSYLGTSVVYVHDLDEIKEGGVCYTAVLPYNFDKVRSNCHHPRVVRLRAVLSWNTPPSTTDPDELETFGNRIDTHIQLKPGEQRGEKTPSFTILGGIPVDKIDNTTGLTLPGAAFALNGIGVEAGSPFARRVVVQGPLFPGEKYRVQVRRKGEVNWSDVITPLNLVGFNPGTGTVVYTPNLPDASNYFDYQPNHLNLNNILAWWDTNGDDRWEVKVDILGVAGSFTRTIQLNHQVPEAAISIALSGTPGAGNCEDYKPGDKMTGNFVARSPYLRQYTLGTNVPGATMIPANGTINTATAPGDAWEMTLPAGTPKCGYYVAVNVVDKTIIDSSKVGFRRNPNAGFCVREA